MLVIQTPDDPRTIIPESIDITYCLGGPCPNLFPEDHVEQVKQLLEELHEINYFSLTYTHAPQRASDMEGSVLNVLSKPDISSRYREALTISSNCKSKINAGLAVKLVHARVVQSDPLPAVYVQLGFRL